MFSGKSGKGSKASSPHHLFAKASKAGSSDDGYGDAGSDDGYDAGSDDHYAGNGDASSKSGKGSGAASDDGYGDSPSYTDDYSRRQARRLRVVGGGQQ